MAMLSEFLLLCLFLGQTAPGDGSIRGVVLNGTANRATVKGATVVLRAKLDGPLVPLAETTTDGHGRFSFEQLPTGQNIIYLPGANRDGVHYPGKGVRLSPPGANARVELIVYDSVASPCPLVTERYDLEIRPEAGSLKVREVLVITNPTSRTYVGRVRGEHASDDSEPETLRLAVPSDFERITFDQEFFGRRFSVVNRRLVTHIPWTPGRKELAFTYVLRNESGNRSFDRPLDLPSCGVEVRVLTDRPEEVSCTLATSSRTKRGETVFRSRGEILPRGRIVRVELGKLPVPWIVRGRVLAASTLVALIAAGVLIIRKAGRQSKAGR